MTESQVTNATDVAEIKEQFSTFIIHFNSCGVRHQSRAFCVSQNIALSKHEIFPDISVIDIRQKKSKKVFVSGNEGDEKNLHPGGREFFFTRFSGVSVFL